jgi:hypothetical protein
MNSERDYTMNYEIQSRNDFLTGSYLVVKIPENELDQHALYTIKTDCPEFILPFHYKSADGQIEFVYKVGTQSKLNYFAGDLSPREYAELWQSILKPLLECGDWLMNPYSFVLEADHLYYDKNKKSVSYVYVPAVNGNLGHDAFYKMAVEVSKIMTVSDAVLENKVLRAILKDFNPIEFMQMLNDYAALHGMSIDPEASIADQDELKIHKELTEEKNCMEVKEKQTGYSGNAVGYSTGYETLAVNESLASAQDFADRSGIDISSGFESQHNKKEKEHGGYRIFSSRSKKKKASLQNSATKIMSGAEPEKRVVYKPESAKSGEMENDKIGVTQCTSAISEGPGLRYIGRANLSPMIQVVISEGEIFTIGRYDAAVGKKQSSFEFEKKTKAVSRRHAVIERSADGYKIIDLASSAGTYINDKKLPPNTPHLLETGCRVSFGNYGADYVWEIN